MILPLAAPQYNWGPVRRLTFEQDRQELRDEAARMSIPERLAAMTELNGRAFVISPEPLHDPTTAFFVRRSQQG